MDVLQVNVLIASDRPEFNLLNFELKEELDIDMNDQLSHYNMVSK